MKQLILLVLMSIAVLDARAEATDPAQQVQPFSAVMWTTTTLHSRSGKPTLFLRRTVYTRDSSGNMRREVYRPTKGGQHDTTAPLERVITGPVSSQLPLPSTRSAKEIVEQGADLGTSRFFGLPASGRRQSFHDQSGQHSHTLETWYCPQLGLVVHAESHSERGDAVVSDLSELHLGDAAVRPTGASATKPVIPLLSLYRVLFAQIAHMERDRQANDPSLHVNMNEIEDHLRKKLSLNTVQWQTLVTESVKVEGYTREVSKEARSVADQDRAAHKQRPVPANTLVVGRATLHKMQLDLNKHVTEEIDQLKTSVGSDATNHIQTYLQGSLAASTSAVPIKSSQRQVQKENAR